MRAGRVRLADAVVELLHGQAPGRHVITQHRDRFVAVGIRRAGPRVMMIMDRHGQRMPPARQRVDGRRFSRTRRPGMNEFHLQMLASPMWAEMLQRDLLPWVDSVADLGDDVLEVGPGPGLTTDLLRERTDRLTAVEVDADLATALASRLKDTNVEVVQADASDSGLASNRFSAATCFTMLHHVPTRS